MYLHEDREQFADVVRKSVQHTNMSEMIIEKDYYVKVITFDYKEGIVEDTYRYNRTGVGAEPTRNICPEVVNYDENGDPSGVQYDRFIPYLIRMVQIQ